MDRVVHDLAGEVAGEAAEAQDWRERMQRMIDRGGG